MLQGFRCDFVHNVQCSPSAIPLSLCKATVLNTSVPSQMLQGSGLDLSRLRLRISSGSGSTFGEVTLQQVIVQLHQAVDICTLKIQYVFFAARAVQYRASCCEVRSGARARHAHMTRGLGLLSLPLGVATFMVNDRAEVSRCLHSQNSITIQ